MYCYYGLLNACCACPKRDWPGFRRAAYLKRLSAISYFAIPRLIERTGTGMPGQGSITSFYTVLADGDDANDPVVDTSRAILDGHILLSVIMPS